jgi:hypothetical protein
MSWKKLTTEFIETNVGDIHKQVTDILRDIRDPIVKVIEMNLADLTDTTLIRKLFVAHMPYDIKDDELMELFADVGNVEAALVVSERDYGFIIMSTANDAQEAVRALNRRIVRGKEIEVKPARRRDKTMVLAESCELLADLELRKSIYPAAMWHANVAFECYRMRNSALRQNQKKNMTNCFSSYIRAFLRTLEDPTSKAIEQVEVRVNSQLEQAYDFQHVAPREAKAEALTSLFDYFEELRKEFKRDKPALMQKFLTENFRRIWEMALPQRQTERQEWIQDTKEYCEGFAEVVLGSMPIPMNRTSLNQIEQLREKGEFAELKRFLKPVADETKRVISESLEQLMRFKEPGPWLPWPKPWLGLKNLREIAWTKYKKGEYGDLLAYLEKLNKEEPINTVVIEWLVYVNCLRAQYAEALHYYASLRNLGMHSLTEKTKWNVACIQYGLGKHDEAFEILSSIKLEDRSQETEKSLLGLALQANRIGNIVQNLDKETDPRLLTIGYIYACESGDQKQTEAYLDRLIVILKDDFEPLPENEPIDENEANEAVQFFQKRGRLKEGIRYMTARVAQQKAWHLQEALATLKELDGDIVGAFADIANVFGATKDGETNVLEYVKKQSLLYLLNLCNRHLENETLRSEGYRLLISSYGERLLGDSERESYKRLIPDAKAEIADPDRLKEKILDLNSKLRSCSNSAQNISANKKDLNEYASLIAKAFDSNPSPQVRHIGQNAGLLFTQIVDLLTSVAALPLGEDSKRMLSEASSKHEQLVRILTPLGNTLRHLQLVRNLGVCIGNEERKLSLTPEPAIRILNPSFPTESSSLSLLIEVTNDYDYPLEKVSIELESLPPFELEGESVLDCRVPAKGSSVLACAVRRTKETDSGVFQIAYTFRCRSRDYARKQLPPFKILVKPFQEIPARYVFGRDIRITEPEKFHGRENDIEKLLQIFSSKGKGGPIFLDGIRRVGKTSLINFFEARLQGNILPVRIDLDKRPGILKETSVFLRAICEEIARKVGGELEPKLLLHMNRSGEAIDRSIDDRFNDFIGEFRNSCPNQKILLIIDEFQRIVQKIKENEEKGQPGLDETPLNLMRSYMGSDVLDFLFSGSMRLRMMGEYKRHPFIVSFKPKYSISFLNAEAARATLERPVREDSVVYPEIVLRRIWELVNGHPNLTQMIGDGCMERLNQEKRYVVTSEDVDQVANAILEQPTNFQFWWDKDYCKWDETQAIQEFIRLQKSPYEGVFIKDFKEFPGGDATLNTLIEQQILRPIEGEAKLVVQGQLLERHIQRMLTKREGILPDQGALIFDHENFYLTLKQEFAARVLKKEYEDKIGSSLSLEESREIIKRFKSRERRDPEDASEDKELREIVRKALREQVPGRVLEDTIRSVVENCEKECDCRIISYVAVGCFQFREFEDDVKYYTHVRQEFEPVKPNLAIDQASDYEARRQIVRFCLSDEAQKRPRSIGTIILVSGDEHFVDIIRYLRDNGKRAFVRGFKASTAQALIKEAEGRFKYIDEIVDLDKIGGRG